ncbi:MAG: glycosyltransferase [Thiohalocapsa sp.]|jgi:glycosyltransferase involved in cell wall biosynthesis
MRVAVAVQRFGDGGVERVMTGLAGGLAALGCEVDLLVGRTAHPYVQALPDAVRVVPLGAGADALTAALRERPPQILFTGKLADDHAALAARDRLDAGIRVVTTVGTPLSVSLAAKRFNPLRTWRERRRVRRDYLRLDGITAVSSAVAEDLHQRLGITGVPLRVLPNPVVPADLDRRIGVQAPHAWLASGAPPVVLAVGGLRKVKDFATLLRAFALLPADLGARLMILGEGRERRRLRALAARLGIVEHVAMPGFVADPFPYLARASAMVLSSRREGLGNVLVEAMAVGTPVAATACPGGVTELLDSGRLGPLTPVGDARALARAIAGLLQQPTPPKLLRAAVAPYGISVSAAAYLDFFQHLLARRAGQAP